MFQSDEKLTSCLLHAVERGMADLRRGVPVILHRNGRGCALVQACETASDDAFAQLKERSQGGAPAIVLTARRAASIGIKEAQDILGNQPTSSSAVLAFDLEGVPVEQVSYLVDPLHDPRGLNLRHDQLVSVRLPDFYARNGVQLAKLACLLPSVFFVALPEGSAEFYSREFNLLSVDVQQIADYRDSTSYAIKPVARAEVPLEVADKVTIVAFRPKDGGIEHMALIVGEPKQDEPVLARIHSECFTGDLLGSLRCDCGDQLRGALAIMDAYGAGILLYLAQEGRGIGLMNKLRAYQLQDRGSDTLEANELVGFDPDERVYIPASEILRQLGYDAVRLMTNNPNKVAELRKRGVNVVERVPHQFPSNGHNERYLRTKAERFNHMLTGKTL